MSATVWVAQPGFLNPKGVLRTAEVVPAWHLVSVSDGAPVLGDGRPVRVGERLVHSGPLVMCVSGLHGCKRILDTLGYAPGLVVCRVNLFPPSLEGSDKIVAAEREVVWFLPLEVSKQVLMRFARAVALEVVEKYWPDAPAAVFDYLRTGSEDHRVAARHEAVRRIGKGGRWLGSKSEHWSAAYDTASSVAYAAQDAPGALAIREAAKWAANAEGTRTARDWDALWNEVEKAQNDLLERMVMEARGCGDASPPGNETGAYGLGG